MELAHDPSGDEAPAGLSFADSLLAGGRNEINRKPAMRLLRGGGYLDDVAEDDDGSDGSDNEVDAGGNVPGLVAEVVDQGGHAAVDARLAADAERARIAERVCADLQTPSQDWRFSPEEVAAARVSVMTVDEPENVSVLTREPAGPFTHAMLHALRCHVYGDQPRGSTVCLATQLAVVARLSPSEACSHVEDWTGIPRDVCAEDAVGVQALVEQLRGRPEVVKRFRRARSLVLVGALSASYLTVLDVVAGLLRRRKHQRMGGLRTLHFMHPHADGHRGNDLLTSPIYELVFPHRVVVGDFTVDTPTPVDHALFQVRAAPALDQATELWLGRRVRRVPRPSPGAEQHWGANSRVAAPSEMGLNALVVTTEALAEASNRGELMHLVRSKSEGGAHLFKSLVAHQAYPKEPDPDLMRRVARASAVPLTLNICIGAQVALLIDLPRVRAGSLGVVVGFANDPPFPVVSFAPQEPGEEPVRTHVLFSEFHSVDPVRGRVVVKAIPLRLAWSLPWWVASAVQLDTEVYVDVRNLVAEGAPLHQVFDAVRHPSRDLYLMAWDSEAFAARYRGEGVRRRLREQQPALDAALEQTGLLVASFVPEGEAALQEEPDPVEDNEGDE